MSNYLSPKIGSLIFGVFACGLALLSALPASAQNGLPSEQLARLKAATVLVLVQAFDEKESGSGFLVAKDDDYGYIATNEHVINTDSKQGRRVRVVWNSGVPKSETTVPATIVGEDSARDLAILRVPADNLPDSIPLTSTQTPRETSPVWVAGFPFGEDLATNKLYPALTITAGTITSLRLDEYNKITRVQVDADINEGNSGGPIVDVTGALVGIATEKIEDTNVGLGIPASELQEMLQGRVGESGMHLTDIKSGEVTYRAVAAIIDPLRRVRSVKAFFVPQAQSATPKPNAQGRYEQLSPVMSSFLLTPQGKEYNGTVTFKGTNQTTVTYWEQIRLELAGGEFKWTQPVPVTVSFGQGIAPTITAPLPQPLGGNSPTPSGNDGGWLGGDAAPQPGNGTAGNGLEAQNSGRLLLGPPQTEAGATYRDVSVDGKLTATMLWSNDGKFVYLLEENGVLHKVSVPEFREDKVLKMEQRTTFMVLTSKGLVIGLPLLQEIWLLSPDTLQLQKRIAVGPMGRLAGSPVLPFVYVVQTDTLSVVDLGTGTVTAQLRANEIPRPRVERPSNNVVGAFYFATMTPDGKYLLCANGGINRLLIGKDGTTLTCEETGPDISSNSNPQSLQISPDSLYVALPCGGGNPSPPGIGPYSTSIYKIADLQKPVVIIRSGAYPRILAFDKVAGYVYAQGDATLMIYTAGGLRRRTFALKLDAAGVGNAFGGGDFDGFTSALDTQQFLPHPSGSKLLVLMGTRLVWVELPPADQMMQDPPPAKSPAFQTPFGRNNGQFGGGFGF